MLAALKVGRFAISMFGIFALIMGGFIILNTFRTLVSERRHDIGMLRAIGATRGTILGIFLIQSLLQGALGTGFGLLIGWGIGVGSAAGYEYMFREILHVTADVSAQFGPGLWATAILLGVGITVLGAVIPARQAARITPLEALRPQVAEVVERERSVWVSAGWVMVVASVPLLLLRQSWSVGLGAVFALGGLVMIAPALIEPLSRGLSRVIAPIAPATADLASSNVVRQPGRAAATASAILVSLAVVISLVGVLSSTMGGFWDYLDKSLGSDFILLPSGLILGGGNVGVDQALVDRIAATWGVGDVATLRLGVTSVKGAQVQVVGIDPVEYPKVASFTYSNGTVPSDLGKLSEGGRVLVNGIYAAQNGVAIGDKLQLETPGGRRYYEVVGVASDYLNAKLATVYISQDDLAEDFGIRTNVLVLANVAPGSAIPAVKADLARVVRDYPQLVLYDSASFKASQVKLINSEMPFLYGLLGIFAIPTLLALLNTLAISVLARTREIGMLRAVGTTRGQVSRMVVAEALLLGCVGILFGIVGGVALGYALVYAMNSSGYVVPYTFPFSGVLIAVLSGLSFALLAAVVPARTAGRLDVVTALHYE
ncbi:MAG: FtsX-like permease family protein [Actinobacteria bacterium]|nr:MAG: FtsX-like permease family protein [Actinomycetota bacterium]